jgi:GNAT superfamily N-acetyltransferase
MTTQAWTIRPITGSDARVIAAHRYYRGEPQQDADAYSAWLPARIDSLAYIGFVAEASGTVIAGAGAVLLDWGPTRGNPSELRARIVNVFTQPAWRRQGIALVLVRQVMDACGSRGVNAFSLAASADGAAMYRALGFQPYAEEMVLC